jgi:hypothetical protein
MNEILTTLNGLRKQLGNVSIVFLTLSFLVLCFQQKLVGTEWVSRFTLLAIAFFSLGLLIGLVKFTSKFFNERPARGILDGLAAGLIAGILGGALGFGYHDEPDSHAYRIGLCVMFALPVGAVIGCIIDFLHPDIIFDYKRYVSAIILAVTMLLLSIGVDLFLYVPTEMKGDGITLGEIQLIFEILLIFLTIIVTNERNWSMTKYFSHFPNIVLGIFLTRIYTTLSIFNSDCYNGPLYLRQYYLAFEECRPPDQYFALVSSIIFFIVWSIILYALFYYDHPLNRWIAVKFRLGDRVILHP